MNRSILTQLLAKQTLSGNPFRIEKTDFKLALLNLKSDFVLLPAPDGG